MQGGKPDSLPAMKILSVLARIRPCIICRIRFDPYSSGAVQDLRIEKIPIRKTYYPDGISQVKPLFMVWSKSHMYECSTGSKAAAGGACCPATLFK